ncbi:MAG: amino acid-binding protein [Deltaproteobacteria bacterium]|nr:amino acid-binding protein [Deltaproteobacteria bacterium]MCL5793063.1 amino acid-binding protein [Deltaproteobacteria bacterium]
MAEQISVFIENIAGRLKEITALLKNANIDIKAITIADAPDFGVVRMIVDNTKKALSLLRSAKFITRTTDVVAVKIENKPGSLFNVLKVLEKSNIDIEYLYSYTASPREHAILVFRFDNNESAQKALSNSQISILSTEELLK